MSRRAHIVRTHTQPRGPATPRTEEGGFNWNASTQFLLGTTVFPGEETVLFSTPHHASLGDEDFEFDGSIVKVRIPRDGIYSVHAIANAVSGGTVGTPVTLTIWGGSLYGHLGSDQRPLVEQPLDPGGIKNVILQSSNAGYPFNAGELVWASGSHFDETPIDMTLLELSVTYEAELGTVYPPIGGG